MHGKPIIVTEYGADAMPGLHTIDGTIWSEEYQVALLETYHRVFDRIDAVVGEHVLELRRLRHRTVLHARRRQQEGRVHPRPAPEGGRTALRRRWLDATLTGAVECRTTSSPKSSLVEASSREHGDGHRTDLVRRQADGRERRRDHGRHGHIVEPHDADVVGDGDPEAVQAGDDPERHLVVEREHRGTPLGHDVGHDDPRRPRTSARPP